LSHFGQNVLKYTLMNTVTASFNTTVRQLTEISQQKMTETSQRKKSKSEHIFSEKSTLLQVAFASTLLSIVTCLCIISNSCLHLNMC